jgi:ammonium transporter, Amt family
MESVIIVILGAGTLLVRLGQAVGAMGVARAKNVASAGLRNLADLCIAILCFWALGAAVTFQMKSGLLGIEPGYLIGWRGLSPNWFSTLAVVLIATGIIGPAVAERSKLAVPLTMGALLAGLLVPLVLHWTRRGWLSQNGLIDNAGAAAIHLAPALAAATAAVFVGARDGKYNRDGSSNFIPGHSVLMIFLSVMLMLAGWVPYVLSALPAERWAAASANVLVSAAAGGLVSLVVGQLRFGKADVLLTWSGVLGGLVSITAAAAIVGTPGAFVIGLVGGLVVPWMTVTIDLRWKIDDPGGFVAVHGVGGVWALLAAAIVPAMNLGDHLRSLGIQLLGIVVIAITTIALSGALLLFLKATTGLRCKEADEYDGLDLAEHDINAHPDFQQTMIKSYHLREA